MVESKSRSPYVLIQKREILELMTIDYKDPRARVSVGWEWILNHRDDQKASVEVAKVIISNLPAALYRWVFHLKRKS